MAAAVCLSAVFTPAIAHADAVAKLVSAFDDLCVKTPPDFDALREKAETLRLPEESIPPPDPASKMAASGETWTLEKDSETFELAAGRGAGPRGGVLEYCQVAAGNMRGDDVREALTKRLGLEEPSTDGVMKGVGDKPSQEITMWRKEIGHSWLSLWLFYAAAGPFEIKLASRRVTKFECVPGQKEKMLDQAGRSNSWFALGPASVVDGQTIDLCGVEVTLNEMAASHGPDALGLAAKQALTDFIGDSAVSCSIGGKLAEDRFAGSCTVGEGEGLEKLMIAAGFAQACIPLYKKWEEIARQKRMGIWALPSPPELKCGE